MDYLLVFKFYRETIHGTQTLNWVNRSLQQLFRTQRSQTSGHSSDSWTSGSHQWHSSRPANHLAGSLLRTLRLPPSPLHRPVPRSIAHRRVCNDPLPILSHTSRIQPYSLFTPYSTSSVPIWLNWLAHDDLSSNLDGVLSQLPIDKPSLLCPFKFSLTLLPCQVQWIPTLSLLAPMH